jgi:outer membrane receptor protein involved in Fe transport
LVAAEQMARERYVTVWIQQIKDDYVQASALLASVAMLPVALSTPDVVAQQITSSVRGAVTDSSGAPISGARITVTDTRTGRTANTITGSSGRFSVRGLESGGPYTVLIDTDNYVDQQVPDLMLSISDVSSLNISLERPVDQAIEEIVVTASALVTTKLAIGPSSSFTLETLENVPSIAHDIRDTIRIDPRVNIDQGNDDNVSCNGANNRFNSWTIDGVRSSDSFGLNASGFPARNTMPIPFDAVKEAAVEFSPFDVEYGQFTGCNINLVTKSGSNEFHGGALLLHSNDSLIGKTLDGDTVIKDTDTFDEWNWAVDLGGPIIKDKLFFYAAYEEVKDTRIQSSGPIGAGFANEFGPTLAQVEQIQGILETVYGQDPGGIVRTLPEESRRILGRLDWFINDQHRMALTYTRMRELFLERDDGGVDFSFRNNFEFSGSEVETYSARIFSDWTDNLSTEIRFSRVDNHDIQNPVGGGELQDDNPIPRFIIFDDNGDEAVVSGPGFFRSANSLITQLDQIKVKADYEMGDHTFTVGYELDSLDVFNLFIPGSTGNFEFEGGPTFADNIQDLIDGEPSFSFVIGPATANALDAAAVYARSIHTLYFQDQWQATQDLTLTAGLRYDFYKSGDSPASNPNFISRYGFDNTAGFNGLEILQPRFGFDYDAPWDFHGRTTVRGGIGVFGGGDPTVWLSNVFTNTGSANAFNHIFTPGCGFNNDLLDGSGNYNGVPQCLYDGAAALAQAGEGPVDALDPNFKMPSILRYSLGFTHITDFDGAANGFFDDWTINVDFIRTDRRNSVDFIDLTLTQIGVAPDGRPVFSRIDPLQAGCDATFNGIREGFTIPAGQEPTTATPFDNEPGGTDPADDNSVCGSDDRDQDILMTNVDGDSGGTTSISIMLNKHFEFDTRRPTSLDFTFGYAYTNAKERNPTTSSTAGSSTEEVALSIVNNAPMGPSQFANKHSLRLAAIFHRDFFDDLTTSVGVFWQARSGRPFSYVFDDGTAENTFGDTDNEARQLLYVPTGPTDPLVSNAGALPQSFWDFLESSGLNQYAGEIAPRNAFNDPWFKDMDLRFSQDLPTPWSGHKFTLFADFENFLNLLGDSNNIAERYRRGDVGEGVPLVDAVINDAGQYTFTATNAASLSRLVSASVWQIQFGIQYRF